MTTIPIIMRRFETIDVVGGCPHLAGRMNRANMILYAVETEIEKSCCATHNNIRLFAKFNVENSCATEFDVEHKVFCPKILHSMENQ